MSNNQNLVILIAMHAFVEDFQREFQKNVNVEIAAKQAAYMKNLFSYLGIKSPMRKEIQKEIFKDHFTKDHVQIIRDLWELKEREYQYVALDFAFKCKRTWNFSSFHLFCKLVTEKSWWDTVDDLAGDLIGRYLLENESERSLMDKWIEDENLWRRRVAIIHQLMWKEKTDEKKLFEYCKKRMHEKEFFIRKAIGWALRQYSKSNPQSVKSFLLKHKDSLSYLSFKEGSKYIDF